MTDYDRDLLWKAWPRGFLAMRGVHTVGAYQCISVTANQSGWSRPGPEGAEVIERLTARGIPYERQVLWCTTPFQLAVKSGDLLPRVDPADTATWACLLADLAGDEAGLNMTWEREESPTYHPGGEQVAWRLYAHRKRLLRHFYIETDDPALALIEARTQLRRQP